MDRTVPSLRVQIGQEVVLRRAQVEVLLRDATGRPMMARMRPQLRAGEILCERLGDIPMIVMDCDCAELLPAAPEPVHFDTWYRHRINVAHAKYMERTSYHLPCDWPTFPPEAIERYLNGSGV